MNARPLPLLVAAIALLHAPAARAWNQHHLLMPWVLAGGMPAIVQDRLDESASRPAPESPVDRSWKQLAEELKVRSDIRLETLPSDATPRQVLMGRAADEPDLGMDQDLDESADPAGERRTMGGTHGPTSQGFRHMYFGGWQWRKPVITFQVPFHAIGQAPDRAAILADHAREMILSGDRLWGSRLLGWATHFIQDLSQPFHAVQVPSLRMIPWDVLLTWPPKPAESWARLIQDSTRTVSNYHFAFEQYVEFSIRQGQESPFADCLMHAENHAKLAAPEAGETPRSLALKVAQASVDVGSRIGSASVAFFGNGLKEPGIDLPAGHGAPDYKELSERPDRAEARQRLDEAACEALANGVVGSRRLISWAFAD